MPLPLLPISALYPLTLDDVRKTIYAEPREIVGNLTLRDLASMPSFRNGVYIFFSEKTGTKATYVGQCSSRSFISRLAEHFTPSPWDYMNYLSKCYWKQDRSQPFKNAVQTALSSYVLLIGFPYDSDDIPVNNADVTGLRDEIRGLESVLREFLTPEFNSKKRALRLFSGDEVLRNILQPSGAA